LNDNSSSKECPSKKPEQKASRPTKRAPCDCEKNGPNTAHNSKDCKALQNAKPDKLDWTKKNSSKGRHEDCQSKCKKKNQELKWTQGKRFVRKENNQTKITA
jgi:hypothetical protein